MQASAGECRPCGFTLCVRCTRYVYSSEDEADEHGEDVDMAAVEQARQGLFIGGRSDVDEAKMPPPPVPLLRQVSASTPCC